MRRGDPSTGEVAEALGVHGHDMRVLAESLSDPTPAFILGWAEADPTHYDLVEEWLDRLERETNGRRVANTAHTNRGERV